ncbi:MAG: TIGR02444 family protein [Gammaproteobacteria bacterium]
MAESLWDFSVQTYHTEEVRHACLALQDARNMDVNLLLFCCWYARFNDDQPQAALQNVFNFSKSWHDEVVQPLRRTRTWMKHTGCPDPRIPTADCTHLRDKIKAAELAAERVQQQTLQLLVSPVPTNEPAPATQLNNIIRNLTHYFQTINASVDPFIRNNLQPIIQASIPDLPNQTITTALDQLRPCPPNA